MKLYGYAVLKKYDEDNGYNIIRVAFSQEVIEHKGIYENSEEKTFYSKWDNFLPKSQIEKVQYGISHTNIEYLVYLLEDNKSKAMLLIKEAIQKEINELNIQINSKQELLGVTCDSVYEIKEL